MARDNFTKETIETLAKRVGFRCSNPNCPKPSTVGPRSDDTGIINLGVAAHITAASEGGPRFDSSRSPQERRSIRNGIWLCQNCAKRIDSDAFVYDMHGNVWEGGQDRFDSEYYANSPPEDPPGSAEGELLTLRGGSWCEHARFSRAAYRSRLVAHFRNGIIGFRVAADAPGRHQASSPYGQS